MKWVDIAAGESSGPTTASIPPIDPAWREWEAKLKQSCPGYRPPPRQAMLVSTAKHSASEGPLTAADVLTWQSDDDRRSWDLFNGVLMQQLHLAQAQAQAQIMQRANGI
jgi:hypothetical protein